MTDTHTEPCSKCRGRGVRFFGRGEPPVTCNTCKGVGVREFKESAERRAVVREKAKARKARKLAERIAEFKIICPEVWRWMETADSDFAASMREALLKWGGLTDRQMSVSHRMSCGNYVKARLV